MEDEGVQKANHEAAARVLGGMMYDTAGQFLSPCKVPELDPHPGT